MVLIARSRVELLGSEDRPLRLIWRGPLRRSPVTRSSLEIQLVLADDRDRSQQVQWLPFAEFGYYPLETEFRGFETWFPVDAVRTFRKLQLDVDFMVPDNIGSALSHNISTETRSALSGAAYRMSLDQSKRPPVAIANNEIARFYLTAISLLASDLLSFDIDPEKAFKNVCEPRATRWLEEGVFQIAPRHGYLARPAAQQLGLVLASDDIISFWSKAIKMQRYLHATNQTLTFHGWLPEGAGELDGVCQRRTVRSDDAGVEAVVHIREIVRDRRTLPMHTLAVQLPFRADRGLIEEVNAALNGDSDAPEPQTRNLLDRLLGRRGSPSSRSAVVAIAGRTLPRAFPGLERMTVEYIRKKGPLHPVSAIIERFNNLDGAALGKAKGRGSSARIVHRHASGEPRREVDFGLPIAPPSALDRIEWTTLETCNLDPALIAFREAANLMAGSGHVASGAPALIDAPGDMAMAGIVPASWGRWSTGYALDRQRRLFGLPVVIEGRFFWIVELESSDKSRPHGIGVLQPTGAFEPEDFLNDYLSGIRQRQLKAPAGTVAAPFPKGHFPDASVGYLKHSGTRLIPLHLVRAIKMRCKRMIDEQRLLSV